MCLPQAKKMVSAGVWVKREHKTVCAITAVTQGAHRAFPLPITRGFEFFFENWRGTFD